MNKTLILAAALSLLGASQALAHARLLRSDPQAGATVKASPAALRLSYSEGIDLSKSSVALAGPAGPVAAGPIALDPKNKRVVIVPIKAKLAPGAYHVTWGMTTEDTHHTDGAFDFKVAP
jgi:methionine-rich copper-binding protein CopC